MLETKLKVLVEKLTDLHAKVRYYLGRVWRRCSPYLSSLSPELPRTSENVLAISGTRTNVPAAVLHVFQRVWYVYTGTRHQLLCAMSVLNR